MSQKKEMIEEHASEVDVQKDLESETIQVTHVPSISGTASPVELNVPYDTSNVSYGIEWGTYPHDNAIYETYKGSYAGFPWMEGEMVMMPTSYVSQPSWEVSSGPYDTRHAYFTHPQPAQHGGGHAPMTPSVPGPSVGTNPVPVSPQSASYPMIPYMPYGMFPSFWPYPPMSSGTTVPGVPQTEEQMLAEQSYVENILRFNHGKMATFYLTYENNSEWNAKVIHGVIQTAGRDHIIVSDPDTGKRYLLLMVNLDYVVFDEPITYITPKVPSYVQMHLEERG